VYQRIKGEAKLSRWKPIVTNEEVISVAIERMIQFAILKKNNNISRYIVMNDMCQNKFVLYLKERNYGIDKN